MSSQGVQHGMVPVDTGLPPQCGAAACCWSECRDDMVYLSNLRGLKFLLISNGELKSPPCLFHNHPRGTSSKKITIEMPWEIVLGLHFSKQTNNNNPHPQEKQNTNKQNYKIQRFNSSEASSLLACLSLLVRDSPSSTPSLRLFTYSIPARELWHMKLKDTHL